MFNRWTKLAGLLAALAVLVFAASANAIKMRVGNVIVYAEGGFSPTKLPRHENAPVRMHGSVKIETVDGQLPPILERIEAEFDRYGAVDTVGLPVCHKRQLEATTVENARAACEGAIVGKGHGHAIVAFPESPKVSIDSPITLFNGPRKAGDPTIYAHAYITYPVPATFIVPVVIETIDNGVYGYRAEVRIPKIAGGFGVPISGHVKIDKKWTYKGETHSYINGRCPTGRVQARVRASFNDDTTILGTILRSCQVRS